MVGSRFKTSSFALQKLSHAKDSPIFLLFHSISLQISRRHCQLASTFLALWDFPAIDRCSSYSSLSRLFGEIDARWSDQIPFCLRKTSVLTADKYSLDAVEVFSRNEQASGDQTLGSLNFKYRRDWFYALQSTVLGRLPSSVKINQRVAKSENEVRLKKSTRRLPHNQRSLPGKGQETSLTVIRSPPTPTSRRLPSWHVKQRCFSS